MRSLIVCGFILIFGSAVLGQPGGMLGEMSGWGGWWGGRHGRLCPWGSMGSCGGFVGARCPWGSYCRYRPGSTLGTCCRSFPYGGGWGWPRGRCPPPSGQVGICVVRPGSCISHRQCPWGQMCCSEGCGSVCKYPIRY